MTADQLLALGPKIARLPLPVRIALFPVSLVVYAVIIPAGLAVSIARR